MRGEKLQNLNFLHFHKYNIGFRNQTLCLKEYLSSVRQSTPDLINLYIVVLDLDFLRFHKENKGFTNYTLYSRNLYIPQDDLVQT